MTVSPGGGDDGGGTLAAKFTYSPEQVVAGSPVAFDGSSSTGSPVEFDWSFGDGASGQGKTIEHTFAKPGTYTVLLTVAPAGCASPGCLRSTSKDIVVAGSVGVGANGCRGEDRDQPNTLCLLDGRVRIQVDWNDQYNHKTGFGHAVRGAGGDTTGFFWFFSPDNIELIAKVLDGSTVNGNLWFFYGALSTVEYEIRVTDLESDTTRTYHNLPGTICGKGDTTAFPVTVAPLSGGSGASSVGGAYAALAIDDPASAAGPQSVAAAATDPNALYLLGGRFEVSVDWTDQHHGDATGIGRPVPGTDTAGYFWFFNKDNLELVVKLIDARTVDGKFWVFWGGLSDVKYRVSVHDLVTDKTWTYTNPAGSICGGYNGNPFGD